MHIIQSPRLTLRPITNDDFHHLEVMLKDPEVMTAWEHTFSDAEIYEWIEKQMNREVGYLLAFDKDTGEIIGQMGLLNSDLTGSNEWYIGYMLCRKSWGKGYAVEGAKACMEYAFSELKVSNVFCDIRPENTRSIAVAKRLGMKQVGEVVKQYMGKQMPHLIFEKSKDDYDGI